MCGCDKAPQETQHKHGTYSIVNGVDNMKFQRMEVILGRVIIFGKGVPHVEDFDELRKCLEV